LRKGQVSRDCRHSLRESGEEFALLSQSEWRQRTFRNSNRLAFKKGPQSRRRQKHLLARSLHDAHREESCPYVRSNGLTHGTRLIGPLQIRFFLPPRAAAATLVPLRDIPVGVLTLSGSSIEAIPRAASMQHVLPSDDPLCQNRFVPLDRPSAGHTPTGCLHRDLNWAGGETIFDLYPGIDIRQDVLSEIMSRRANRTGKRCE
jgi:hypothetical protein